MSNTVHSPLSFRLSIFLLLLTLFSSSCRVHADFLHPLLGDSSHELQRPPADDADKSLFDSPLSVGRLLREEVPMSGLRILREHSPLRSAFPGFDSQTLHFPPLPFDGFFQSMLDGAESSVQVDLSKDGQWVEAKVNLQQIAEGKRAVKANVLGGGRHLRVRVLSETVTATHTISLPARVTGEGMKMERNDTDHSLLISMKVVADTPGEGEKEATSEDYEDPLMERDVGPFVRLPGFLANFFGGDDLFGDRMDTARGPESADERGGDPCAHKHGGDPLKARRCECEMAESDGDKALCFASIVSSGMKLAKRLGLSDVSSEIKHEGMACVNGKDEMRAKCLESVVNRLIKALDEKRGLNQRIRAEIEGDITDSDLETRMRMQEPARAAGIGIWILLFLVVGLIMWVLARERRRHRQYGENGLTSRLSSALTMAASLAGGVRPSALNTKGVSSARSGRDTFKKLKD